MSERSWFEFDVRAENGRTMYRDSASLPRRGALNAGTIDVPTNRVGIGSMNFVAWRVRWQ